MKKSIFAILVTVLASLSFTASADPLRLIVTHLEPPLVPNSVMDLAKELGYFEREGIDVEIIRVQQTPMALAALQSGEGDLANVSSKSLLQLIATHGPVATAITSPNKSLPFLIAAREEIGSVSELKGRSFGIGRVGSLDHSLSSKVLNDAGTPIDLLELVPLGQPAVRAQTLAAGKIDATTMSIGTWMSIPEKNGIKILIDQKEYFQSAPIVNKVIAAAPDLIDNRREDVVALVRALTKLSRDFSENPKLWAEAMAPHTEKLDSEQLLKLAKSFENSWSVNGGLNSGELTYTQEQHYKTKDFVDLPMLELHSWVDFSIVNTVLGEIGIVETSDQLGS